MPGWVIPASAERRALLAFGLEDPLRISCRSTTWARFSLGAMGIGGVLEPNALALGRCRAIKKIMKVGGTWRPLKILRIFRTTDSRSPHTGCAPLGPAPPVVSALALGKGLKAKRGSLDTPFSPSPQPCVQLSCHPLNPGQTLGPGCGRRALRKQEGPRDGTSLGCLPRCSVLSA